MLKWVGSKRWQVPLLRGYVVNSRIVELFAGSAALSFGLPAGDALLNDANPHLINFYRHAQAGTFTDFSGLTTEKEFYARREWFNRLVREGKASSATAAGLFYYLNCTAFNNLWRVNASGEFNTPFRKGRDQVPTITSTVPAAWVLTNEDFRDVMLEPDDFVYADPPYVDTFADYTAEEFTEFDFAELVALLMGHPGRVVITNSAQPVVLDICRSAGLNLTILASGQKMQHARGRTDSVPEVMATNFPLDLPTGALV